MIDNALKIQGWMSYAELSWLASTARDHIRIAEVGSYLGRSTRALCDNTKGVVFSVDPYEGDYYFDNNTVMRQFNNSDMELFHSNLKDHLESGKLTHLRRHFHECSFPGFLDFVFIDGDHRELPLTKDIFTALEWLKSGGIIAGHDYTHSNWPSVKKVVDKFFPNSQKVDSIWWTVKS